MVGFSKIIVPPLPSVDFPSRRAETNENKSESSTLRLRSDYLLPVHLMLLSLLIDIRYLLSGYFYFQGILGTTAEIAYGFLLFAFGF